MRILVEKPFLRLVAGRGSVQEATDAFLASKRAAGLSEHTLAMYRPVLRRFAGSVACPLSEIGPEEVEGFLADLTGELSRTSIRYYYSVVRAFLRWARKRGRLSTDPLELVDVPRKAVREIEVFTETQVKALLASPNLKDPLGLRDYALMALLLDTGLRIAECMALKVADLDFTEGRIRLVGKGNKGRSVFFGGETSCAVRVYLKRRENDHPALWLNQYDGPLTVRGAAKAIKEHGRAAHIVGVRVSPHTFRHTFATMYLRAGGDVLSLQQLLGHADVSMTMRYVHLTGEDLAAKHRQFSPVGHL